MFVRSYFVKFLSALAIALSLAQGFSNESVVKAVDAVTCAKIMQRSCKDRFEALPNPLQICTDVTCMLDDWCTPPFADIDGITEPLMVYTAIVGIQDWDKKWDGLVDPDPDPGRLYTVDHVRCLYEHVCMYECEFIAGVGRRCRGDYANTLQLAVAGEDKGPCPAGPGGGGAGGGGAGGGGGTGGAGETTAP